MLGFTPVELFVIGAVFVLLIGSRVPTIIQRINGLRPFCGRRVRIGDIGCPHCGRPYLD